VTADAEAALDSRPSAKLTSPGGALPQHVQACGWARLLLLLLLLLMMMMISTAL
jgi:hypothetical protein